MIEPLWGSIEMMTFFLLVNTGVAIVAAIFYYFLYMLTFNTELLFEVHIHGLAGYLAGVSVAVKQAMPDHILYRSPLGKITNRNIPLTVFGLTFIMWAIGNIRYNRINNWKIYLQEWWRGHIVPCLEQGWLYHGCT